MRNKERKNPALRKQNQNMNGGKNTREMMENNDKKSSKEDWFKYYF